MNNETSTAVSNEYVRAVPVNYAWKWFSAAWMITKSNYGPFLGAYLLIFLSSVLLQSIEYVGSFVHSVVGLLLAPGILLISKAAFEQKPIVFSTVFRAFRDQSLLVLIAPYILVGLAATLITRILISLVVTAGGYTSILVPLLGILAWLLLFTIFSILVISLLLHKNLSFPEALVFAMKGLFLNFHVFLVVFLMFLPLIMLSTALIFVPLVFIIGPLSVGASHLIYATIFEGYNLDEIHNRFR